jgi:hypothetical protein
MEHIEVGDLVMIVHAHCPESEKNLLGQIHTVLALREVCPTPRCANCGASREPAVSAELLPGRWHPTRWLRRIRPLESEQREERAAEALC